MPITVGSIWAWVYFIIALAVLILGILWLISAVSSREVPLGGVILIIVSFVVGYLWIFAATHFRVQINERALVINTIDQSVIGVRGSGVQPRPFIGVKPMNWPANTMYKTEITMKSGVASATTKNGTSVYISTTVYLDLSNMDLEGAFKAYNGPWETFLKSYLEPQLMGVARNVSQNYYTIELTTFRARWETDFEENVTSFLALKGYGVKLVPSRTIMSWDFVNQQDADAFDNANRAGYLVTQRENEKAALQIEADMVAIRSQMMSKTADATVEGLKKLAEFIAGQPEELRPYLIQYLQTQVDLEYLRLVAQLQPGIFFPPGSQQVLPTYNVAPSVQAMPTPIQPTPAK